MLERLLAEVPELQRVFTGNASENEHMIAINSALGFAISLVTQSLEIELPASAGA